MENLISPRKTLGVVLDPNSFLRLGDGAFIEDHRVAISVIGPPILTLHAVDRHANRSLLSGSRQEELDRQTKGLITDFAQGAAKVAGADAVDPTVCPVGDVDIGASRARAAEVTLAIGRSTIV